MVTKAKDVPAGFLSFVLHAHLPYVINHGTWPHGIEWLHEAAAETYLPLLRILANLQRDQVPANFNINLSPVLLEQLSHPVFIADFPKYVTRKIVAAREDEAFFIQPGKLTWPRPRASGTAFSPPRWMTSARSTARSSTASAVFRTQG